MNGLATTDTSTSNGHCNGNTQCSASPEQSCNETQAYTPSWHLFRFCTWKDVIYLLLGLLMSAIAGCSLPLIFFLLGLVITEFTNYTIALNSSTVYFCNTSATNIYLESTDTNELLREKVASLSYCFIGVAVTLFMSSFLSNSLWSVSALRQIKRMRLAFLHSVIRQDIGYYDINSPVELPTKLADDIHKIEEGIGANFGNFIQECVGLIVGFIIAMSLNWKLALVTSTLLPILFIIMVIVGKISAVFTFKEQSILSEAGGVAEEVLSAIKTVIAFGGETREMNRYTSLLNMAKVESYKKQITVAFAYGFYTLIFFSFYALGIWYGSFLLTDCLLTAGDIVTIVLEVAGISFNIGNALPLYLSIAEALGVAKIVYPIIDRKSNNDVDGITLDELNGTIEFSHVTFAYPSRPDVPVLSSLSFHIKPGQTIGLVGPSGGGKSSILQLIQKLYTHNEGLITIDGVDINELSVAWLREKIGVVSQDPILFNTTIGENIAYGKEGATHEEIVRAAKAANAYNFISLLPNNFNTLVGEGGSQLSGGQKQCIAIARALIRDPKILLLDEATSSLDTDSERIVQEALDKAREGRTTIMIAHRLATIQGADMILCINEGRIVEMGVHHQLMAEQGLYYKLVLKNSKDVDRAKEAPATNDIIRAYRHSTKVKASLQRRPSSLSSRHHPAHSTMAQATSIVSTLKRNRRPSAKQVTREASTMNFNKKIQDTGILSPVNEFSVPPTPIRTPKFSPQFDLDDVFELPVESTDSGVIMKASWKSMLRLNKPDWLLLLIGITGFILAGVLLSTLYILLSEAINVFIFEDKDALIADLMKFCSIYLAFGVVGFIVHFFATFALSTAADNLTTRIRHQCFEKIMQQDLAFFDRQENSASNLIGRLAEDASDVNKATGLSLGITIRSFINIFASYIIVFQASWSIGLLSLIILAIMVIEGFLQLKLTNIFIVKSFEYQNKSLATAIEAIESIYTVATLGIEDKVIKEYDSKLKISLKYDMQGTVIQSLLFSIAQSSSTLILACALNVGAYSYTADPPYFTDINDIFRAIGAILYTGLLFKEVFRSLPDTQTAKIAASNILQLLEENPLINATNGRGLDPKTDEKNIKIKLSKVFFSYPSRPGISVLPGLDLNIKHNQTLGIVGPSGCGKSTIISLIERFYDPNAGSIQLNGINSTIFNVSWLRRQMSLVPQEPTLFDMSISDNIRYGALYRDVTDEEIVKAAKDANIHDFIMSLSKGYGTNVGPKGTQLSGGEKQRIAIARALIRDPKILLLDEATSSLDTDSERIVQEALDQARKGRTTIIIAHRLSTIEGADNIAVIHKGLVVEQGTHAQLIKKKEAYYLMYTEDNK